MRTISNQFAEEIVDDSEPERAELRTQSRSRSKFLARKVQRREPEDFQETIGAVFCSKSSCAEVNTIIEISDSDSSFSCNEATSGPSKHNACSGSLAYNPPRYNPQMASSLMSQPSKPFNLNRFVFTNATIPKNSTLPIAETIPQPAKHSNKATPYPRPLTKKSRSTLDISNADLAKVTCCVCCKVSWTTRKTAAQKLSHIQTCARKHAFDEETVRILVQKQVINNHPHEVQKGKRNTNDAEPTPSTSKATTFLEDVVVDTAPKKKTRRRQAETLLANISQSRPNILARAKTLITGPAPDETAPSEGHLARNGLTGDEEILPHEQFSSESALGQLQATNNKSAFWGDNGGPPTTQGFAESTLGRLQSIKARSLFSGMLLEDDEVELPSPPRRRPRSSSPITPKENGPGSPYGTSVLNGTSLDVQEVFEIRPHKEVVENPKVADVPLQAQTKPLSKRGRPPKVRTSGASPSDVEKSPAKPSTPNRRNATTGGKTSVKKKKVSHLFDEKWESHMKLRILQDQELHMRVLRYEPIHFDVFLEHAVLYAPSSPKMRRHLRHFLDDQAIHFYGAEGIAWKR